MWIDSRKYLELLDELINQAEQNVSEYEDFHQDRLANIPTMNPIDSFLYGLASGKLQQLQYLKQVVESRKSELGEKK